MVEFLKMQELATEYGNAFYILDTKKFESNFLALKNCFKEIYPNYNLAYSYKTNYIPKLCKKVNDLGGYAEVVSEMELELAKRVGVLSENIIWNGPCKNLAVLKDFLLEGGTVNVDNFVELNDVVNIAEKSSRPINVGVRCNFDIGDGVVSRFGFDVDNGDLLSAVTRINRNKNLNLKGIHCHFSTRNLQSWENRVQGMLAVLKTTRTVPEYIDLGGGLFGNMPQSLKDQFGGQIPTFEDYAMAVATPFKKFFDGQKQPTLILETGTALVSDCMKFVCRVMSVKEVRGKNIATLYGSVYNINPTLNGKNMPVDVLPCDRFGRDYQNLDFAGYTCIEGDYLYRGYNGKLKEGDFVVFHNVGSYSVVLKPPFILPNFAILELNDGGTEVVKRGENFLDIFHTFTNI